MLESFNGQSLWLSCRSVAIPSIVAGLRMDRVGRKGFLIVAYLCYVPAMLIFVFADFYMLLLAFFFFGLGQMLQLSSYQSLLGDLTPRELRGKSCRVQSILHLPEPSFHSASDRAPLLLHLEASAISVVGCWGRAPCPVCVSQSV